MTTMAQLMIMTDLAMMMNPFLLRLTNILLSILLHLVKLNLMMDANTSRILNFPDWLPNRLIPAGLQPVLSKTEKSCIASYFPRILN